MSGEHERNTRHSRSPVYAQMNSSGLDESNLQSSAFGDWPERALLDFHGWAKSTNPACTL